MIFNRETLKDAAQQALIDLRAKYDERIRRYEDLEIESEIAWIKMYGPRWIEACNAITEKIGRGEPVTYRDIPTLEKSLDVAALYGGPQGKRGNRFHAINTPDAYEEPAELRKLLIVLDLCTDETVSTYGLKELGIGQRVMSVVMDYIRKSKDGDKK
jgi:hypothetical protein